MAFVSIYTVGMLKHHYDHPASREFYEVGHQVMRQAAKTGQLIEEFSPFGVAIPEEAKKGDGFPVLTLTVWKSLHGLYRFSYSGQHSQAMRDRSKWIESYPEKHLSYVVWWTEKVKDVSWQEAFKRYNFYLKHGPTSFAFDFKHTFDEKGEKYVIK
ncbi:DUF3291 domain-containing protein [Bacillus sp. EB106-08-02-XG196]|uniref:DUF3291 domain-containing protein n=1 Tax=Bacillus sp. EB106-08-02-XG196 TaxID=2737049 RepID=UPI0015C47848|nr:DUF3291 domain-containing protein [Bacillus sp. EB106-08-02-XG196]NWQ43431.1 DUF3291 domain-containing protein [Bacillus sp. EB106-08-02-XG196]